MDFGPTLFKNWDQLIRVVLTAPLLYVGLITMVNVFGKRSTSKMNNFDWVVTVAMGSIFASCVVLKTVPLVSALLAFLILLGMQWAVNRLTQRSDTIQDIVRASPRLVYHNGEVFEDVLRDERLLPAEFFAKVREHGYGNMDQIAAVVFEADASMSVIPKSEDHSLSPRVFKDVEGWPDGEDMES